MLVVDRGKIEAIIHGDSIDLVPQKKEHAREMSDVLNDERLYEYIGGYNHISRTELENRYEKLESRTSPDGTAYWLNWVIVNHDNKPVGYIQATIMETTATVAWVVGRTWQNRRYGKAAATLLEKWIEDIGCLEMDAYIHPENANSKKLAFSLGFTNTHQIEDGEEKWIKKLVSD